MLRSFVIKIKLIVEVVAIVSVSAFLLYNLDSNAINIVHAFSCFFLSFVGTGMAYAFLDYDDRRDAEVSCHTQITF